jgi:calcineurin-like phosphoesterase family protein
LSRQGSGDEMKVRDFDTPLEMTQKMADNFNAIIPEDGILFHLGDWSFAGKQNIEIFRNMLNVKELHLITGNHDEHIEKGLYDHLFTTRQKYLEVEIGSINLILFHFNINSWNNISRNSYHLHGHQHWTGNQRFGNGRKMDVGVDGNDLKPYRLLDVINLLKDRQPVDESGSDHHI